MRHEHPQSTALHALALLTVVALLAGCAWRLPWRKPAMAAPAPIVELRVEADEGNALPTVLQFWNRNNLRVDLGSVSGKGSLRLRPSAVNGWPMRIEFAVRPASVARLEVRGDKRVVFSVTQTPGPDGALQVLQLGAGVYTAATPALTVSWE